MESTILDCQICNLGKSVSWWFTSEDESLFGMKCNGCGCLAIIDILEGEDDQECINSAKWYPKGR